MHAHLAIVLPAALKSYISLRIVAGDDVVEIAPLGAVHGVEEAALGVGPALDAFLTDGVVGRAVEVFRVRVEVRVSGQVLALAVHEQLIGNQSLRGLRLLDAVAKLFPFQVQPGAAANDGLFTGRLAA